MKNSAIQWTRHTYNPWLGCRKVAPECLHCYIVTQTPLRVRGIVHGAERHRCSESTLRQPLAWDAAAARAGERHRVFCLSLGDWLDDEVPIEWLADLLERIDQCRNLDWQLLTKRPGNFEERIRAALMSGFLRNDATWLCEWIGNGYPPQNVWIGVSAGADQRAALEIPAKIHFLSCEPMLKPLDTNFLPTQEFDWIIFGGESGKNARPCNIDWIRNGLEFCQRNKITSFVKQLGRRPYFLSGDAQISMRTNRHRDCVDVITDSHGGDWNEWPADLRVREFPA